MERNNAATQIKQPFPATQPTFSSEVPAFTPVLTGCLDSHPALPPARHVPPGTLLIEQGQTAQSVHLVRTGLLKLVHMSACGREIAVGLRSEGWYGGSTSALLNIPSVYSVRTVTACTVARIPVGDFSRYLRQSPEMLGHFLEALCLEVASQASLQVEVMSSSAEDRLDHFMRERTTIHPSRRTLDPLPSLKQMELAQLLSITPEHLSRLMHKKRDASLRGVAIKNQCLPKASASQTI